MGQEYQNRLKINRFQGCGLDTSGSGKHLEVGSCKHSNEPLNSVTDDFLDWLRILLVSQEELCSVELVIIFKYYTVLYHIRKFTKVACKSKDA